MCAFYLKTSMLKAEALVSQALFMHFVCTAALSFSYASVRETVLLVVSMSPCMYCLDKDVCD